MMRRWLNPSYLALSMGLVVLAATAFLMLSGIQRDITQAERDFRGNLVWFATRIDYDRVQLLNELNAMTSRNPPATGNEFARRFDVFWSRINEAGSGVMGQSYMTLPGAAQAIARAKTLLQLIESDAVDLKPGDVERAARIRPALNALSNPLQQVVLQSVQRQADLAVGRRAKLRSRFWQAIVLFVAAFLTAGTLVVLLYVEKQNVAKLRDDLEQRVNQRTRELGRINKELQSANNNLRDFAMIASHDLQEPLRKIRSLANMLSKDLGALASDDSRYALDVIEESAVRLSSLVAALLRYSRLSNAQIMLESVALDSVVSQICEDLDEQIEEAGALVEYDALPHIMADPVQLRQLLQNVLVNALKYRQKERGCRIRIAAHENSAGVTVTISDNGIGFSEEYNEKIFEPFQRLHRQGDFEGTGIGLTLCAKIAERHGWNLSAEGRPGKGARIILDIPKENLRDAA